MDSKGEKAEQSHPVKQPSQLEFDADLSPYSLHNIQAGRERGLRYDPRQKAYLDVSGCLIRDQYGQPL